MKKVLLFVLVALMALSVVACAPAAQESSAPVESSAAPVSSEPAETQSAEQSGEEAVATIAADLLDRVNAASANDEARTITGPDGEAGTNVADLADLTEEEKETIRQGNYTAAICMHYTGNDWSTAQIAGITKGCEELGIKIITTTDANYATEEMTQNVETVIAMKPDIIFAMPVQPEAEGDVFKRAADAGIKLVFMDQRPVGLTAGKDYAAIVASDNYGNGVTAARILGEAMNGKGTVGMVYHFDPEYFPCHQRDVGFQETIEKEYPGIEIVVSLPITNADEGAELAEAMLTQYPDLGGMYYPWDVPAEYGAAAAQTMGRSDLLITAVDLGTNIATLIAGKQNVPGVAAQYVYDQGLTQAVVAGYALLGKEIDPFIVVSPATVTYENVIEQFEAIYQYDAPAELQNAFDANQ